MYRRPIGDLHYPDRSLREACTLCRSRQDCRDRRVAPDGLGSTSQEDHITGLEAQAGHIGGYIRPGLVRTVHEQRLDRIAHPWPFDLGIKDQLLGHGQIGRRIDIHMTEALLMGNHRNRRRLSHGPDEFLSASGDDEIDISIQFEERMYRRPIGDLHYPDRSLREACTLCRSRQDCRDRRVAPDGLGSTSQEDHITGLEAQAGHIGGYIRPGLVDDGDHTQGDAHTTHPEAVGAPRHPGCDRLGG